MRFSHEYELKDDFDGAWAARPLELRREGGRVMLLLEDPGGEPLERLFGAPMPFEWSNHVDPAQNRWPHGLDALFGVPDGSFEVRSVR